MRNLQSALRFVGRGSAFNVTEGNTSAFLSKGPKMLLIDCGSNISTRLIANGLLEGVKEMDIFITHLHPDHVGSLGDLLMYTHWKMKITPVIHYPSVSDVVQLLSLQGVTSDQYAIGEDGNCLGVGVKFLKITHSEPSLKEAFSLSLLFDNFNIFYTGDVNVIDLDTEQYDEIYHEVTTWEGSPVHVSYGKLLERFPLDVRKKIHLMHLDGNFDHQRAERDGFNVVVSAV